MIHHPWRFLIAALAAAWAADILFWQKPLGISFLVWSILVIGSGLLLAKAEGKRMAKWNLFLIAAVLLLAVVVSIRLEPFTQFVSFIFGLFLILLLPAVFLNGHWFFYRIVDYIAAAFNLLVAAFSRPVDLSRPGEATEGANSIQWKRVPGSIFPLLRGVLLAVPVVLVLGGLLVAADPVFSDWIEGWLKFFNLERFAEYLFRFFYILMLAYLFTGLYIFAIHPKREAQQPDPDKPLFPGFLGWIETAVILTSVNLLFAVFLIVQFRYFFGGTDNIVAAGFTYAEYARRGFGELIAVAVLSLLLYLGLGMVARLSGKRAQIGFTSLTGILILQVVVILVSAFQRLLLYEDAYGFTRLRTYSHVFMVWLAVLLGAVLVLEILRKRTRFALALLTVAFGFCVSLAALNVDALVVRQNVRRAATSELDAYYLKQLSADAVPSMVDLFQEEQDEDVQAILGAELACRAVLMQDDSRPWQSFSLSHTQAARLLGNIESELDDYPVSINAGRWVTTVGDEVIPCSIYDWQEFD
jgi:hypothetical protein